MWSAQLCRFFLLFHFEFYLNQIIVSVRNTDIVTSNDITHLYTKLHLFDILSGESCEIRIAHILYDLFIFVSYIISFFLLLLLLLLSPSNIFCGNNRFWLKYLKFQPKLRGWTVSSIHFTETNQQIFNYFDWSERQNAQQHKNNQFDSNFSVVNINLSVFFCQRKFEMFVERFFFKISATKIHVILLRSWINVQVV